jgi:hypothetical protein
MNKTRLKILFSALMLFGLAQMLAAQTTTFTYQGKLSDGSTAANGSYDLGFALFDQATGGTQIGAAQTRAAVTVTNGVFTVQLDFGANPFASGANRFLEIAVKRPSDSAFTTLTPRQQITSAPYAVRSLAAASADNATNATNATNAQNAATANTANTAATAQNVSGVVAISNGGTGSTEKNFVDLTTDQTIAGNKTFGNTLSGNIINAQTQFNIGGSRVFSARQYSLSVGIDAGSTNGEANSFFGRNAGNVGTTGGYNSFFGLSAGAVNIAGSDNSFFGAGAGTKNTTGDSNSFFGLGAGNSNTIGDNNSFFGAETGRTNTTGENNTLIGYETDVASSGLSFATALGAGVVVSNSNTVVLGRTADTVQVPGNLNVTGTFTANINGASITNLNASNIATGTLDNARLGVVPVAKGGTGLSSSGAAGNFLRSNGTGFTSSAIQAADIPAGSANYIQNTTAQQAASFNLSGNGTAANLTANGIVSANAVNSATGYNIGENRVLSVVAGNSLLVGDNAGAANTGSFNSFFGTGAGVNNTFGNQNSFVGTGTGTSNRTGSSNTFLGASAGSGNTTGSYNLFVGRTAGYGNTTGSYNTIIGTNANVGADNLSFAAAIGAEAVASRNNSITLGRADGSDAVLAPGNVEINRDLRVGVNARVVGSLIVQTLAGGGDTQLCRRTDSQQLAFCSSSLRYKTNIAPFSFGLNLIKQLRPISFDWKTGGAADVGFGAEDVAKLNPLLVTYNKEGAVEGVKYDRFSVLFVNAFQEQQTQIETQQTQIERLQEQLKQQQSLIGDLKTLVCQQNPNADVCKK